MPVYNASATVGRMIESIIGQTFTDWELIAVDDGSTDNSGAILHQYAELDSRIKVIQKPNSGVADARQIGMEHASGAYTIHADADDWAERKMLEEMFETAYRDNADIVICDYYTDTMDGQTTISVQHVNSVAAHDVLYALYTNNIFGALWHKLIRRTVYEDAKAQFTSGINYCEDLLVLTKIFTAINPKISYLPRAYYHYVANPNSLTQHVSHQGLESMKRFHDEALKYLPDEDRFGHVKKSFSHLEFLVYFMNRLYPDEKSLKKEISRIESTIGEVSSVRWKLGFFFIKIGLIELAHRLIRF